MLKAARPFLVKAGIVIGNEAMAAKAVHSVKEKVSLLSELPAWVHYFFNDDYAFENEVIAKLKAKPENATLLAELKADFAKLPTWDEHTAHASVEATAARLSVKPGALMPLLRFALSGQSRGPGVATILDLIGQAKSVARIERALALLA